MKFKGEKINLLSLNYGSSKSRQSIKPMALSLWARQSVGPQLWQLLVEAKEKAGQQIEGSASTSNSTRPYRL